MNLFPWWCSSTLSLSFALVLPILLGATTLSWVNGCNYTEWPDIQVNSGNPMLLTTGFELPIESSRSFQVPTGWAGRLWARTGCTLDRSGFLSCQTGDCGSRQVECNGAGPPKPVTLAELTLGGLNGQDFYDVSLVHGFNAPINFEAIGGSGSCGSPGCVVDLNPLRPAELALGDGKGCKAPCEALGNMCRPNVYSEIFKAACPRSYSYPYDDNGSAFICTGADFVFNFCPSSSFSSSS